METANRSQRSHAFEIADPVDDVRRISSSIPRLVDAWKNPQIATRERWKNAVEIVGHLSKTVLDELTPGHPVIGMVDVLTSALTGYFLNQSDA